MRKYLLIFYLIFVQKSREYIQTADKLYEQLIPERYTAETFAVLLKCLKAAVENPYGTSDEKAVASINISYGKATAFVL